MSSSTSSSSSKNVPRSRSRSPELIRRGIILKRNSASTINYTAHPPTYYCVPSSTPPHRISALRLHHKRIWPKIASQVFYYLGKRGAGVEASTNSEFRVHATLLTSVAGAGAELSGEKWSKLSSPEEVEKEIDLELQFGIGCNLLQLLDYNKDTLFGRFPLWPKHKVYLIELVIWALERWKTFAQSATHPGSWHAMKNFLNSFEGCAIKVMYLIRDTALTFRPHVAFSEGLSLLAEMKLIQQRFIKLGGCKPIRLANFSIIEKLENLVKEDKEKSKRQRSSSPSKSSKSNSSPRKRTPTPPTDPDLCKIGRIRIARKRSFDSTTTTTTTKSYPPGRERIPITHPTSSKFLAEFEENLGQLDRLNYRMNRSDSSSTGVMQNKAFQGKLIKGAVESFRSSVIQDKGHVDAQFYAVIMRHANIPRSEGSKFGRSLVWIILGILPLLKQKRDGPARLFGLVGKLMRCVITAANNKMKRMEVAAWREILQITLGPEDLHHFYRLGVYERTLDGITMDLSEADRKSFDYFYPPSAEASTLPSSSPSSHLINWDEYVPVAGPSSSSASNKIVQNQQPQAQTEPIIIIKKDPPENISSDPIKAAQLELESVQEKLKTLAEKKVALDKLLGGGLKTDSPQTPPVPNNTAKMTEKVVLEKKALPKMVEKVVLKKAPPGPDLPVKKEAPAQPPQENNCPQPNNTIISAEFEPLLRFLPPFEETIEKLVKACRRTSLRGSVCGDKCLQGILIQEMVELFKCSVEVDKGHKDTAFYAALLRPLSRTNITYKLAVVWILLGILPFLKSGGPSRLFDYTGSMIRMAVFAVSGRNGKREVSSWRNILETNLSRTNMDYFYERVVDKVALEQIGSSDLDAKNFEFFYPPYSSSSSSASSHKLKPEVNGVNETQGHASAQPCAILTTSPIPKPITKAIPRVDANDDVVMRKKMKLDQVVESSHSEPNPNFSDAYYSPIQITNLPTPPPIPVIVKTISNHPKYSSSSNTEREEQMVNSHQSETLKTLPTSIKKTIANNFGVMTKKLKVEKEEEKIAEPVKASSSTHKKTRFTDEYLFLTCSSILDEPEDEDPWNIKEDKDDDDDWDDECFT